MSTKCSCQCQFKNCCKNCAYGDAQSMDPLKYDYWNQTWWMNWNTTDGWGAFPSGESGQNNNTYDNLSGFGTSAPAGTIGCNYLSNKVLPNGKKYMRVYKYSNRFYEKSSDLVFYNNKWVSVSDVPGVEKTFRIVTV